MFYNLCIVIIVGVQLASCLNEGDECLVNPTGIKGVCTPARKCESARNDYENNGIRPTFCNHDSINIIICCSNNSQIVNTTSNENSDNKQRVSERKCEEYSGLMTETVSVLTLEKDPKTMNISVSKCNYAQVDLLPASNNAMQGEFPHMAAIGWVDMSGEYVFYCGGSLISSRYVLTAAHCYRIRNSQLRDPQPQIVRLGEHNLNPAVEDNATPIDVPIKTIHKHPGYFSPKKYNDIALIELNADITFTTDIRPACLWTKPTFPGYTKAIITGWGYSKHPTKKAEEPMKVPLTLLENYFCNTTLMFYINRHWSGVSDGQLCAGNLRGGKDTCPAESGSPLQVESRSNRCIYHIIGVTSFHIIGVTSFGRGCAKSGTPAVYTRVSSYVDWIEGIVWPGE